MLRVDCAGRHDLKPCLSWLTSPSICHLSSDPGFSNIKPGFRPGKTGFWFLPTRAIDSEHNERGPYKFSAHLKQFEKIDFRPKKMYIWLWLKKNTAILTLRYHERTHNTNLSQNYKIQLDFQKSSWIFEILILLSNSVTRRS